MTVFVVEPLHPFLQNLPLCTFNSYTHTLSLYTVQSFFIIILCLCVYYICETALWCLEVQHDTHVTALFVLKM